MQSILVVVNIHNTVRVAYCWFIIYYTLVMRGNSNTKFWCGICSGSPPDSKLSHLMRSPRVTNACYMDVQYKLTYKATPSFPLGYLEKEKEEKRQTISKTHKTLIKFQTVGYKSKNNTYN